MKVFLVSILLSLASITPAAEPPQAEKIENRFLFVVETSATLHKSASASRLAVIELIRTRIHGQMRPGDTFGIWTFNKEISANRFPMRRWSSSAAAPALLEQVNRFFEGQKYEHEGNLDCLVAPLFSVIRDSKALSIILISEGKQSFEGIPFADEIYAEYQEHYNSLREAHLPFVTTLVVREGEIRAYAVSSALPPIRIPNLMVQRPAATNATTQAGPTQTNRVSEAFLLPGTNADRAASIALSSAPTNGLLKSEVSQTAHGVADGTAKIERPKESELKTSSLTLDSSKKDKASLLLSPTSGQIPTTAISAANLVAVPQTNRLPVAAAHTTHGAPSATDSGLREKAPAPLPLAAPQLSRGNPTNVASENSFVRGNREQLLTASDFSQTSVAGDSTRAQMDAAKTSAVTGSFTRGQSMMMTEPPVEPFATRPILIACGSIATLLLVALLLQKRSRRVQPSLISQSMDPTRSDQ